MAAISRAAWFVILLAAAGCAAATVRPPAAPRAADSGSGPEHIAWSAARRLTWADFQGPAPGDTIEAARTVYLLSAESRCRGQEFQFSVAALFIPLQSWVKPNVLTDADARVRVLSHEQTHFDLTELYARRMRRYFAELYNPCGLNDDGVRTSVDRFVREEADAQARYDKETRYGLDTVRQHRWNGEVTDMLAALDKFAAGPSSRPGS